MNPPIRLIESMSRICVVTVLFVLQGCAPLPVAPYGPVEVPQATPRPQPSAAWLGRIAAIDGPNAYYDKGGAGTVFHAAVGQLLYARDRFFTGPGTHMLIQFNGGGQVELDENTDPTLLQELNCLVISLFRSGQMFVDKSDVCVEAFQVASSQHSKVMYSAMPGFPPGVRITVVEGRAELVRPSRAAIPAGWRIDANARGVMGTGGAYPLPPEELQRSTQWLHYYRFGAFPPPVAPEPRPPVVIPGPPIRVPLYPPPGYEPPRPPVSGGPGGSTGGVVIPGRTGTYVPPVAPSAPGAPSGVRVVPGTSGGSAGTGAPPSSGTSAPSAPSVTRFPKAIERVPKTTTTPDSSVIR